MKYGIISDIHSNIEALNLVLEDLEKKNVDKILCLGDLIGIGPNPDECIKKINLLGNKCITVYGNHEGYYIHGIPEFVHNDKRKMSNEEISSHKWQWDKLSDESIKYLKSLHEELEIEDEEIKIHLTHYPKENGIFKKVYKNPRGEELQELYNQKESDIYLFGHTHNSNIVHKNEKWYINPGSLGCPSFNNFASYGILSIANKKINYKQCAINYDIEQFVEKINKSDMPNKEFCIKHFVAGQWEF